ncbi:MAG: cupin domain-containing protein [Bacteroidetes bacterium]|nr:cupin domain-containing protein [Bacteroidota bacterium]
MNIRNLDNSPQVPFDLDAYILHSEEKIEIVHLLLKPGEKMDEHKNPFDVIFFITEGKGSLSVEGKEHILTTNDTIKITSEKNRGWENNSNQNLRLLVIKLLD